MIAGCPGVPHIKELCYSDIKYENHAQPSLAIVHLVTNNIEYSLLLIYTHKYKNSQNFSI